jgi:DnaJ-class molecular chaperone
MDNHYKTLGVSFQALPSEIKAAYRRLAQLHHPDVLNSREDRVDMAYINRAWSVLKDAGSRKEYDEALLFVSPRCEECTGVGKVSAMRGFHVTRSKCLSCEGVGRTLPK